MTLTLAGSLPRFLCPCPLVIPLKRQGKASAPLSPRCPPSVLERRCAQSRALGLCLVRYPTRQRSVKMRKSNRLAARRQRRNLSGSDPHGVSTNINAKGHCAAPFASPSAPTPASVCVLVRVHNINVCIRASACIFVNVCVHTGVCISVCTSFCTCI